MGKKLKHDRYVDDLCEQIKPDYDHIYTNVALYSSAKKKKKRVIAEIDIIAFKDNKCDVFEVKCSHRAAKARKQLRRIKKLVLNINIANLFFFCGESGCLEAVL